jgi:hypothetical protein
MSLTVAQPTIAQDGATGAVLSGAKPITLTCPAVTFADGSAVEPQQATRSAYVLYRQPAGSLLQAWDSVAKTWRGADPAPAGDTLFQQDGAWKGIVVPIGQKDAAGNPVFDPAASAAYSFACFFDATDAAGTAQTGASPRSGTFTVAEPGQDHRGGIAISPDDPAQATRVELFLRDASLADRATVVLDTDSSGWSITLTAAGAVVELTRGGIALTPAAGNTVRVNGELEVAGSFSLNGVVTT